MVHAGRLITGAMSFVFGSSNLRFYVVLQPAGASYCTTNTLSSCSLESSGQCSCSRCTKRNDVSVVDNRTHGGQRSVDVSVRSLHAALLAVPNTFHVSHLATRIGRLLPPTSPSSLALFSYRPSSGSARRSWQLPNRQQSPVSLAPRQLRSPPQPPGHFVSDSKRQTCCSDSRGSSHLSSPESCTSFASNSGRTRPVIAIFTRLFLNRARRSSRILLDRRVVLYDRVDLSCHQ